MSAIADFRIIDIDKLEALKEASEKLIEDYWNFLDNNSIKLEKFNWSGYIFADLLIFLQEEKQIDLFTSEFDSMSNWISEKRNTSVMIFTFDHKNTYLDSLELRNFSTTELVAFNKDFSEDDSPELAKAEMDGIKAIRNSLDELKNENKVVLLTVS